MMLGVCGLFQTILRFSHCFDICSLFCHFEIDKENSVSAGEFVISRACCDFDESGDPSESVNSS